MKYVLFYESSADDVAQKAALHLAEHRVRWGEFRDRGALLLIGPFTDRTGSMGVFTSREEAEAFATGDPFVLHGVVKGWTVREWNEVLLNP